MSEAEYVRMCSKFETCSVNVCPLDTMNDIRPDHHKDPKRVCQEHPRRRLEIFAQAVGKIPGNGLTKAENKRIEAAEITTPGLLAEWDSRRERIVKQLAAGRMGGRSGGNQEKGATA